jgi:peroxiredoxin (alkyl hydroperoxide reductase subunit C)
MGRAGCVDEHSQQMGEHLMDTQELKHFFENLASKLSSSRPHEPTVSVRPTLQLNGPVPDFVANSTQGEITLSKWNKDKWVILFSHPADFTPVCTTEFIELSKRNDELAKRNVALLGSSVDSVYAHIAWVRNIKEKFDVEVPFPVIADLDQKIARLYGMIHEPSSNTAPVRAVFFIDPKRNLRAMIYYPLNAGRNVDEIVRVIDALQMVDETGLAAPANWRPGDDAIMPPPTTATLAQERSGTKGVELKDWYFCKTKPGQRPVGTTS